jgi:hypothetical protein
MCILILRILYSVYLRCACQQYLSMLCVAGDGYASILASQSIYESGDPLDLALGEYVLARSPVRSSCLVGGHGNILTSVCEGPQSLATSRKHQSPLNMPGAQRWWALLCSSVPCPATRFVMDAVASHVTRGHPRPPAVSSCFLVMPCRCSMGSYGANTQLAHAVQIDQGVDGRIVDCVVTPASPLCVGTPGQ